MMIFEISICLLTVLIIFRYKGGFHSTFWLIDENLFCLFCETEMRIVKLPAKIRWENSIFYFYHF
jgi:hypothetical protein